ncbi:hypothetical protein SAMN05216459_101133 [Ensifer sp. OV372]|nr:hypothetical protein SAMN05216459_101133 [Ensifer sp. OV372]
MLLPEAVEPLA